MVSQWRGLEPMRVVPMQVERSVKTVRVQGGERWCASVTVSMYMMSLAIPTYM